MSVSKQVLLIGTFKNIQNNNDSCSYEDKALRLSTNIRLGSKCSYCTRQSLANEKVIFKNAFKIFISAKNK